METENIILDATVEEVTATPVVHKTLPTAAKVGIVAGVATVGIAGGYFLYRRVVKPLIAKIKAGRVDDEKVVAEYEAE